MRKALIGSVCLVVAAAAAYLGVSHYIGGMVAANVALYERRLLEIDGVSVTRFVYDKRLFDGHLVYDIAWRPPLEHPLREAFDEIAKTDGLKELRIAGRVPVRHGPWVGKFAAARAEFAAALPDEARRQLPKYPGQAPWLTIDAIVEWSGEVNAAFRLVDYDGRVGEPDDPQQPVAAIEGLRGRAWIARDATRATLETSLSRLQGGAAPGSAEFRDVKLTGALDIAARHRLTGALEIGAIGVKGEIPMPGGIAAGPFSLTLDATREWPFVWTGDFVSRLRGLAFDLPDLRAKVAAFDLRAVTIRKGDKVDSTIAITMGPTTIADAGFPAIAFDVSLRNLDGATLNDWTATLDSVVAKLDDPNPTAIESLSRLGAKLVAAGPQFAIDRLSLSVRSPDDVKLTLRAQPATGVELPKDRFAPLFEWLDTRVNFTANLGSIEAFVIALARIDSALEAAVVFGPSEERIARERFARAKEILAGIPIIAIQGDSLSVDAALARGQISLNGRLTDPLQALAAGAEAIDGLKAALLTATGRDIPDVHGVPSATRAISRATFQSGTLQQLRVQAGGNDLMDGRLGADCAGYINARRATLVIDYTAGGDEVVFSATSPDADTALIVHTPEGAWICNDDGPERGVDPIVRIERPAPGRYHVWVATVEPERAEAIVQITPTEPARRR